MAKKANSILDCVRKMVMSRSREVICPLCSALVKLHLEFIAHLWALQYNRDMDVVEQVQYKATKMFEELNHISYV